MAQTSELPLALLEKAKAITTFFIDVDGVLTDGSLYFAETGEVLKKFNSLDGHGLKLLKLARVVPVIITGRDSPALRKRLSELQIENAFFGVEDKKEVAQAYLQSKGLDWQTVAAIGDDWPDLPVLAQARCSFAPLNAHAEVKARVDHVCALPAGQGAVREACDIVLVAKGVYDHALSEALK
jgi:3-deoxy-D-manno-octulosonate 8-phosphate phosphatase (KDO 8-P phosphatase)